jgi:hypothetical protein
VGVSGHVTKQTREISSPYKLFGQFITHTAEVGSPYKAGLDGHCWTQRQVELSA